MNKIVERKAALRAEILQALRAMSAEQRAIASERIRERILALKEWQQAERVLLFTPMRSEPDIAELEQIAHNSGKRTGIVPTVLREEHELELAFTPDLIILPGLAFSRDRHRMGRGGGFYDRLLAGRAREAFKLGVCFALQLRDEVPHAAHDVILDAVISA
ncbi:MAG TPA: 5-formyltetrahydrofolate cyclo-ligase [Chthoniobacterales bacterium]|nr:5-formyltetrahydrofolate cyclo-ligase [Chthoniobacterales bacterium]